MDERLTKIEIRVLGAILTFRDKSTNLSRPTREQISERCGYGERTVSKATSSLVEKGWLVKTGKGGSGMATTYRFTVPDIAVTLSEPDTVSASETLSEPGTVPESGTVPDPGTKPCPIRAQNPVRTGHTNRPFRPFRPKGSAHEPPPEGVDERAWRDFCQHRTSTAKLRQGWTDLARTKAANLLRGLTPEQQRQVVDYSITGGYPGLFPDRLRQGGRQSRDVRYNRL